MDSVLDRLGYWQVTFIIQFFLSSSLLYFQKKFFSLKKISILASPRESETRTQLMTRYSVHGQKTSTGTRSGDYYCVGGQVM